MFGTPASLTLVVLVLLGPVSVSAVFFSIKRTNETVSFRVRHVNVFMDVSHLKTKIPFQFGSNLPSFYNLSAEMTPDERCLKGKPLAISSFYYQPYAYYHVGFSHFSFYGIFPALLKNVLKECCHPKSKIEFADIRTTQRISTNESKALKYDFYFPIYGSGMEAKTYKDFPFIPIIQAPNVVLLVYTDNSKVGKSKLIITTILKKFPVLLFIFLTASTSGILMWILDHSKNEEEFSKSFVKGAWEGFWWAFITMTTVGYGDRIPKTILGRIFCFCWIIFGIIIFSIFSGLITANLYAGTQHHFEIRGAKIGGIGGTAEFMMGIGLNAEMKSYDSNIKSFGELVARKLEGLLMDSYAATYHGKKIAEMNLRRDRIIPNPITYGMMLAPNSTYIERCMRKYINDNPQGLFEIVREKLKPEKNKADRENLLLKEAKKLFYRDDTFKKIIEIEAIVLGVLICLGVSYQVFGLVRSKIKSRKMDQEKYKSHIVKDSPWLHGSLNVVDDTLSELIEHYHSFHEGWVDRLEDAKGKSTAS